MSSEGEGRSLRILRQCPAPDAVDSVCQEVALSSQFKRTDQTTDACLAEFDLLRHKAWAGPSPKHLRLVRACRTRRSRAPESRRFWQARMAGWGSSAVAKQRRRLFVPRGGAARHGFLAAADIDSSADQETEFEA